MENLNRDNITRNIIAASYMEIDNPQFAAATIHAIKGRKKRKLLLQYIFSCVLLIIVSAVLVVFSIPAQQPLTGTMITRLDLFGNNLLSTAVNTKSWFSENMLFLIPVIILFVVKKIIDLRIRNSVS